MKHYFDFNIRMNNAAVSFGIFDGVHTGHRAVIEKMISHDCSVVISFVTEEESIYTETEKEYLLDRLGVGNMISVPAKKYMTLPMDEFVGEYLVQKLGVGTVVVGENYEKLTELKTACEKNNITIEIAAEISDGGEPVTSDMLKRIIKDGDMDRAFRLMGGSYVIAGPVVHGKGAGRQHGMPTANLGYARNKIWPKNGVYGTAVRIKDSSRRGVTNIGPRPSDDNLPVPTCETYILDFDGSIYDTDIVLEAFIYVRPVIRFSNLDEVKEQIDKDIEWIKKKMPDAEIFAQGLSLYDIL